MKIFILALSFLFFISIGTLGAEEARVVDEQTKGNNKITLLDQHKEDDVLLTFYDDKGEIIKINWNGTIEYQGDLDYVSSKFWPLLFDVVPQMCQRDVMLVTNTSLPSESITIKTMKGDIILKKDQIKNTMSIIYLSTLDDHAIKFWKSIEKSFPNSCK